MFDAQLGPGILGAVWCTLRTWSFRCCLVQNWDLVF